MGMNSFKYKCSVNFCCWEFIWRGLKMMTENISFLFFLIFYVTLFSSFIYWFCCCFLCLNISFITQFSCRWARRGDVWEAADLIQQMKHEGVQPDIHTYTSFINACCKAGDMLVCLWWLLLIQFMVQSDGSSLCFRRLFFDLVSVSGDMHYYDS